MSERQAKRLRRAARAYIVVNRASLAKGEPVLTAAHKATAAIARTIYAPHVTHGARGEIMRALERRPLLEVASILLAAGIVPAASNQRPNPPWFTYAKPPRRFGDAARQRAIEASHAIRNRPRGAR